MLTDTLNQKDVMKKSLSWLLAFATTIIAKHPVCEFKYGNSLKYRNYIPKTGILFYKRMYTPPKKA